MLVGILFGITGVLMVLRPVSSARAATLLMSVFFLIAGLYQVVVSLRTHVPGWGWQSLNGTIATVIGFSILAQLSVSGLWMIGLFVGIDLIFYGSAWIASALDLHKL
jgi:uncharacterized membrane protein HdeD (DUF308 family)